MRSCLINGVPFKSCCWLSTGKAAGSWPFQCKAMVETGGWNVNWIAANGNETLQLG
jgi:hypothetical protein